MTKTELIKAITEKVDLSIKDTSSALDAALEVITETLKKGEKVNITGFASFELKDRPEREGINPSNGQKVKIPACKAPNVKFSKTFKDAFNS